MKKEKTKPLLVAICVIVFYIIAFLKDEWSAHVCSLLIPVILVFIFYGKNIRRIFLKTGDIELGIESHLPESCNEEYTEQGDEEAFKLRYRIDRCERLTLLYYYILIKASEKGQGFNIVDIAGYLSERIESIHGKWRVVSYLRATYFATAGFWEKECIAKNGDIVTVTSIPNEFKKQVNDDIYRRLNLPDRESLNNWFKQAMDTVNKYFENKK